VATVLAGNGAAAWGFRLSRVQCYPYYPITPSTACSQQISRWVYDGAMEAVTINAESEHSAASQIIAAGKSVRAGTATSSKGLLYMIEVLENAAGGAVPSFPGPAIHVASRCRMANIDTSAFDAAGQASARLRNTAAASRPSSSAWSWSHE